MDLGDIMIALTIIAGIGLLWLLKILVYDRIKARWEQYKANQALLATVTKPYRGTRSERRLVLRLLLNNFSSKALYHDLYLDMTRGHYSQLDIVLATRVGVVVFEVKEMSGWIFGSGHHQQWTQILAYGRLRYRFYNPILQNQKHIHDLRSQLPQFAKLPFYSVLVFDGSCEFKKLYNIPSDVYLARPWEVTDVLELLLTNNPPAEYADKEEVIRLLETAVQNGENPEIRRQHVLNVHQFKASRYNFQA
ncbi:MAG: nuclease-related domain-containing protein [Bacteroidota bacterium]